MTSPIITTILNTFRAGQITRTMKDVLLIMASRHKPASYEAIAHATGCSRRMVAYTLSQAEALGLLERVHHRIKRGGRWMNGKNTYRFVMKVITERFVFPWKRSQCKICTIGNEDIKIIKKMPHSPEEYRYIMELILSGLTPEEAGYRGNL